MLHGVKVKIVASAFLREIRYEIPALDIRHEPTGDVFVTTRVFHESSAYEFLFDDAAAVHIRKKRVKALFYCYV